jgi:hypothetical protein
MVGTLGAQRGCGMKHKLLLLKGSIKTIQTPRLFGSDRVLRAILAPGAYRDVREEANNRPQVPRWGKKAWGLNSNHKFFTFPPLTSAADNSCSYALFMAAAGCNGDRDGKT